MEFFSTSINTHVYAIMILLLIMIFNLFSVIMMDNFIKLAKRLKFMTPLYHMLNAIVAYTGAIVAAFAKDLSPTIILMIATSIFVMVLEIKRYKKQRVIKSTEKEKQDEFRRFAKKIYIMEIAAIVFTYTISKLV